MSYDDDRLEQLLSNGHLSGAAYDRIEERVLAKTARETVRPLRRWLALAAAAVACTVALLLVLTRETPMAGSGFTAKGEPAAAGTGAVELACSSEPRPCRPGDTLMFLVDSGAHSGYLNASAVLLEPRSDDRIWFFPTDGGDLPHIPADQGVVVASKGVRLSPEEVPGSYRVDIWFSASKPKHRVPPAPGDPVVSVRLTLEE